MAISQHVTFAHSTDNRKFKCLTGSLFRTLFAVFAPSSTHGAAAHHTCLRLHHGVAASIAGVVHVTEFFAHVDTFLCRVDQASQ